jgi:hypothetical protein
MSRPQMPTVHELGTRIGEAVDADSGGQSRFGWQFWVITALVLVAVGLVAWKIYQKYTEWRDKKKEANEQEEERKKQVEEAKARAEQKRKQEEAEAEERKREEQARAERDHARLLLVEEEEAEEAAAEEEALRRACEANLAEEKKEAEEEKEARARHAHASAQNGANEHSKKEKMKRHRSESDSSARRSRDGRSERHATRKKQRDNQAVGSSKELTSSDDDIPSPVDEAAREEEHMEGQKTTLQAAIANATKKKQETFTPLSEVELL